MTTQSLSKELKDICDRLICSLKFPIQMYCNEGNYILTAYDMHAALTAHPVKGASPSVNEINQSVSQLKVKKLNHFSAFHNFRYEKDAVSGYGKRILSVKERNLNVRISTLLTRMRQIFLLIKRVRCQRSIKTFCEVASF